MSAPRIGVTGVVRRWNGSERTGVNTGYVRAVAAAGGIPIVLPPLIGAPYAARALDGLAGLLLTGGEDIHPSWYGEAPSPQIDAPSCDRDTFEFALFAIARQRGLPILAICRGIQLVNVALGGTLYQDLPAERPGSVAHNPSAPRDARTHRVRLASGSRLAAALRAETLMVNSIHHQGIKTLAPGLCATGWTDDGLIEAVESTAAAPWLLAVQWHPEEMQEDPLAPERGLFRAFVEVAKRSAGLSERRGPAGPGPGTGSSETAAGRSPR